MLKWSSEQYAGLEVSVAFDRYDGARAQYTWRVTLDGNGPHTWCASDLRMGSDDEPNDSKALAALASFLGAWAEAREYIERNGESADARDGNDNLFPRDMWDATSEWENITNALYSDVTEG